MEVEYSDVPFGILAWQKISNLCCRRPFVRREVLYRLFLLFLTYISYLSYHMSRKPISVVKNVLVRDCNATDLIPPPNNTNEHWCDWAPFDGDNSQTLLGALDSAFLFAYAAGMFASGIIAERVNLRYFLAIGMVFSGVFTYLFGMGYTLNIHVMSYYVIVQIFAGLFQSTGWPGVVTAVANWFGKGKRGLIFGFWNSHTSIGNIVGTLIAGYYVETNWGLSFIVPGGIMASVGMIIFLFMVSNPESVGCSPPNHHDPEGLYGYESLPDMAGDDSFRGRLPRRRSQRRQELDQDDEQASLLENTTVNAEQEMPDKSSSTVSIMTTADSQVTLTKNGNGEKAISFYDALFIPGVLEFSLCLFFAKLVNYTFLFWLPKYIKESTTFTAGESADLSTLFDVGGIVGGIIAGILSDTTGMSALVCAVMLVLSIPMLLIYQVFGAVSLTANIALLMVVGLLVNGPYALITTAVSAELGTHKSLLGSARALATVTAIIDGTGSIGAAVGPLLAGPISSYGWNYVFYMLMAACVAALLLLSRLVKHDIQRFRERRREVREKLERIA